MARRNETPRAHQGVLLGRGAGVRALRTTCARSPCASKFSGNPRRPLVGGGALSERNVFGGWHREEKPGRENYRNLFLVREDPSIYSPLSLHRVKEWMISLRRELQQAVVAWCYLLIARSIMHVGFGLTEDLEARVLKRKPRNTPRAAARPTQDGRRGSQRLRERDGGCRANRQGDLQEKFPRFNNM